MMKHISAIVLVGLLSLFLSSYDDAGLIPTHTPAGIITFTQQSKLITLNPSVDN